MSDVAVGSSTPGIFVSVETTFHYHQNHMLGGFFGQTFFQSAFPMLTSSFGIIFVLVMKHGFFLRASKTMPEA